MSGHAVAVYRIPSHTRSRVITDALMSGIEAAGDRPQLLNPLEYKGKPEAPVCAFYGLDGGLDRIFQDYKSAGLHAVYVDLGYWERRQGGRWTGYHKVVVNHRHPVSYFMRRPLPAWRAEAVGVKVQPWRRAGGHILLAGMGDKGAGAEGFKPEGWERETIAELRRYTKRQIVYRPKPSWKQARPILGASYSPREQPVEQVLANAWAVVTHHSNVAVDGLVAGVPAFTWGGVALPMALSRLDRIEDPLLPEGREQWAANIAWQQWSVREIAEGLPWRFLKAEGLLP